MGGREGRVGVGEGSDKKPQVNYTEGPPFRSRVEFQAGYTQLARSTGANVSVMVL